MKKTSIIIAAALALASCGGNQHKADDPLADTGRTQRTENLLTNLKALGDSSVWLFGHQDDTVYGVGWEADYTNDSTIHQRSDVKSVCNDYIRVLKNYGEEKLQKGAADDNESFMKELERLRRKGSE